MRQENLQEFSGFVIQINKKSYIELNFLLDKEIEMSYFIKRGEGFNNIIGNSTRRAGL